MNDGKPSRKRESHPSASSWDRQAKVSPGDFFTKKYQPEYSIPCIKKWPDSGQDQED